MSQAKDTIHLVALLEGLAREKARFAADGAEIRKVWIEQREREIARECEFLGIEPAAALPEISDDELLAELAS